MKRLTLKTLKEVVSAYVVKEAQATGEFTPTYDNIAGLLDKVAKTFEIPTNFYDKLPELDGEMLSYGKTLEETHTDLTLAVDFDSEGKTALAPHDPSYRPASYSYDLGTKTIATTERKNNLERAFTSAEEYANIINIIAKKLYDSYAVFRYATKRQLIGNLITKCTDAMKVMTAFNQNTQYAINTIVKDSGSERRAIVIKAIPSSANRTFDQQIEDGNIVVLDLVKEIAKPVDTLTGEAFIEEVKKDIEMAGDINEGHSLNGTCLGAEEGLKLYILQGIQPVLEVQVEAGAFNADKLALPAEIKAIKDFGNADANVYAVLLDPRGVKLHPSFMSVDDQKNAEGAFWNYFLHTDNTGFISRNTFVKVYKVGA